MHHHNAEKQTYLILTENQPGATKLLVNAKALLRVKNTAAGVFFYQHSQGELVSVVESFDKIVNALKDAGHTVKDLTV